MSDGNSNGDWPQGPVETAISLLAYAIQDVQGKIDHGEPVDPEELKELEERLKMIGSLLVKSTLGLVFMAGLGIGASEIFLDNDKPLDLASIDLSIS